ncbi:TolC family protein [Odoribacter laneus]|uniref:TolC family protein n=1 Tax=Odoribacter laneus TaxID=626933 RepID=UPI003AF59193
MKIIILFLWLSSWGCCGRLMAQVQLTRQQCREMALENSKQMAIAGKDKEKAIYTTKSVRADFFPKISVSGFGFYNQEKYSYKLKGGYLPTFVPDEQGQLQPNVLLNPETGQPVMGADGRPVFKEYAFLPDIGIKVGLRGVYMAGVQLLQPVYMGGKIRTAHLMAKTGEWMADENLRLNRSEVLLETDKAYWQLMRVQEQIRAAKAYRKVVGELVQNIGDAEEVGMTSSNEVLKVKVRYNEAELMLQKAENGLVLSRMNLCRLIGLDLYTEIVIQDTLPETITPGILGEGEDITERPDYHLLKKEVELKQQQIQLTRSEFLPQIGVSVGYGYGGGLELNGKSDANASLNAMASVQIPVFYWGEGRNKVRVAQTEQEMTQLNLEKSAQLMELEVASTRFNIKDAQKRIEMCRDALAQAKENLRISQAEYEIGTESLSNLLEAQAQWQDAWSQWVDAKAILQLSETEYLKAIGRLGE